MPAKKYTRNATGPHEVPSKTPQQNMSYKADSLGGGQRQGGSARKVSLQVLTGPGSCCSSHDAWKCDSH